MLKNSLKAGLLILVIGNLFASNDNPPVGGKRSREGEAVVSSVRSTTQIYTIPTYDAAFKWILSDDDIRKSFLETFVPGLKIEESKRLDDHMNPLEDLKLLRTFLHNKENHTTIKSLTGETKFCVTKEGTTEKHVESTKFLHEMIGKFDDFKKAFPKVKYNGTMDFSCRLNGGGYALVEMQVIPQDFWDERSLAYVAAFYGNQLRRGQEWKDIKKVVGINILGGGKDSLAHWKDTPDQFVRHYKFKEQLHKHDKFIEGIEIWQYSIMNMPHTFRDEEIKQQDWYTFFKGAQFMSEEEVKLKIKTEAVLAAFERSKFSRLPAEVQEDYQAEDKEYNRFSNFTQEKRQEGKEEGIWEMVDGMINEGDSDEKIARVSKMGLEQIKKRRLGKES